MLAFFLRGENVRLNNSNLAYSDKAVPSAESIYPIVQFDFLQETTFIAERSSPVPEKPMGSTDPPPRVEGRVRDYWVTEDELPEDTQLYR